MGFNEKNRNLLCLLYNNRIHSTKRINPSCSGKYNAMGFLCNGWENANLHICYRKIHRILSKSNFLSFHRNLHIVILLLENHNSIRCKKFIVFIIDLITIFDFEWKYVYKFCCFDMRTICFWANIHFIF